MSQFAVLVLVIVGFFVAIKPQNSLAQYNRPQVLFTFDDVDRSVIDLAFPLLQKKQMKATAYVTTNFASNDDMSYLKWNDLRLLERNGWEIGAHSVSHPEFEKITPEQIEAEVKGSKDILESQGFKPTSFAVPFGSYNDVSLSIIHKYFKTNRGFWTGDPLKRSELTDLLNLNIKQVSNMTQVSEIRAWIDQAVKESKTLILVFHIIDKEKMPAGNLWGFNLKQFEEVVDYVATKKNQGRLDVVTVSKSTKEGGANLLASQLSGEIELKGESPQLQVIESPWVKIEDSNAFLIKIYVDAQNISKSGKIEYLIEEEDKNLKKTFLFLDTAPTTFHLSKTYIPTSSSIRSFRVITKFAQGCTGKYTWEDFQIQRRIKL